MSFDLDIRPRNLSAVITLITFTTYFESRSNYEVDGYDANFFNEKTGASFAFIFGRKEDGSIDIKHNPTSVLATFVVSYNQDSKHHLATIDEAAKELECFVNHFGCTVFDPQTQKEELFVDFSRQKFKDSLSESFGFGERVKSELRTGEQ